MRIDDEHTPENIPPEKQAEFDEYMKEHIVDGMFVRLPHELSDHEYDLSKSTITFEIRYGDKVSSKGERIPEGITALLHDTRNRRPSRVECERIPDGDDESLRKFFANIVHHLLHRL